MSTYPSVTIITSVLNQKEHLKHTIENIRSLNYPNLQYVVVDGGSKDGTVELIQDSAAIDDWVSGPDRGIADAFNRGLELATGEYINFQGAGDYFLSVDAIYHLMKDINAAKVDLVCGKVLRISEDNQPLWAAPKKFSKAFNKKSLLMRMALPHQGLFTHRRFFEKFGFFDINSKFAMDYELLLRAYHHFPTIVTKDILVAAWRAGGVGQGKLSQIFDEYHKIKMRHQVASPLTLNLIDRLNRLKALIKQGIGRGQ